MARYPDHPSGMLLASVADPICRYLRGRHDTIRCLVAMVTAAEAEDDEGMEGPSLRQELQKVRLKVVGWFGLSWRHPLLGGHGDGC